LFARPFAFYKGDLIDVGVEVMPMKSMQMGMDSRVICYEEAIADLKSQCRGLFTVTLIIVGMVS
jgi:hypothetical protein